MTTTFTPITPADIAALREICTPERVYHGEAISPDLAHDELAGIHRLPEVVVEPISSAEVTALLRYAQGDGRVIGRPCAYCGRPAQDLADRSKYSVAYGRNHHDIVARW